MKQGQTQKDVIGLTLQLHKFSVGTSPTARYESKNTVLGHYDNLIITKITRWLDFSPRADWESSNRQNTLNAAVTHYPLKLLFPDWKTDGEPAGFAYEAWKTPNLLLRDNPCMTVVLLNLTDTYKNQVRHNLLSNFLELLTSKYDKELLLDNLHCCVLPSLGYSDFCILMAGTEWEPAFRLVEYLHNLTIEDENGEKTAVLSTDYMMPVFHRGRKKISSRRFKGMELSVRVNLAPSITAQQLADCLSEVQVYRISGRYDCLLWARGKQGQQQLIDFLLDTKTGNLVIDMASTPQLLVPQSESPLEIDKKTWHSVYTYIDQFENAINYYRAGLKKHKRHCRQANALWELAATIRNICAQSHTGDLCNIMAGLIENFSSCLKKCADSMNSDGWDFDEMEARINQFTDIVSNFLSDLSRSDCFFMERDRYNHTSVSSATSLLIAYNQWLNGFTNTVSKATIATAEKHTQPKYAFLVTSGGRDQTQTLNAFYFLESTKPSGMHFDSLALVTQMSEMSLFDFSGTILRSAHECMHFSGERRRNKRAQYMVEFVNLLLSQMLANALLPDDKVRQYAENRLKELKAEKGLLEAAEKAYRVCWQNLANNIFEELKDHFDLSETDSWNESKLLCRNVREWIYETLMQAFSGYEILDEGNGNKVFATNKLAQKLYGLTQQAQRSFFEQCDQLCRENHISTVLFAFGAKRQEIIAGEDDRIGRETDVVLSKQVQIVLSRLLITTSPDNMPVLMEKSDPIEQEPERSVWEKKFPYFALIYSNLYSILRCTEDIFSESFADVAACTILRASIEDYLLMHVYEDWNLNSVLQEDVTNYYRISAVLKVCFPKELNENGKSLKQTARDKIEESVQRLEGHGMPKRRLEIEELCTRINRLLERFHDDSDIGKPLLDYLKLCRDYYDQDVIKEQMEPFSSSFKAIRLLSINPIAADARTNLLAMYNAFIDREGNFHNNAARMS